MDGNVNLHSMFTSIAHRYDMINTILSLNLHKQWRKKAIQFCNLHKGNSVLDLCCGTGNMMYYMGQSLGPNHKIIGLDFSEKMLTLARKKLNQALPKHTFEFVLGNVLALPFPDASFDCVTISFGIRNISDKRAALQEIHRVLKPAGRIVCLELSRPNTFLFREIFYIYFNMILPLVGYICSGGNKAYFYLRNSVNRLMSKENLKREFENVGFQNTFYKSLTFGTVSIHYGNKSS